VKLSEATVSARVASRSSALSDDDLSQRAGEGLAEELTRIVGDPDRVAALHQILGPFCHQSRNILNSLKISLYLAHRKDTPEKSATGEIRVWEDVEERYRVVEGLYDRLQMMWRPLTLTLVSMSLSLLLEDRRRAWVADFAAHGRGLDMRLAGKADAGEYDPHWLGLALDAFVAWRASAGERGREAELRWSTRGGQFHLEWLEPPSPSNPSTAPVTGEGAPAAATRASDRPEPLALPYLSRVIAAHGGILELLEPAGCHLRLCWPQVAHRPN
jgi:hypothetical protein